MNKADLVNRVAEKTDVSKSDTEAVIGGMFDVIAEHVARSDEKLTIPGFLSVEAVHRAVWKGRNPRTGEEMDIAASRAVKVSAGSKLKKAAKGG